MLTGEDKSLLTEKAMANPRALINTNSNVAMDGLFLILFKIRRF